MSASPATRAFPPPGHDHEDCIADALATAEAVCRRRGLRLTTIRRQVLELVWASHRPIGAYHILDELRRQGRRAAPPTVYRALDFLIDAGLAHRLDSLNAFVGCPDPQASHSGQFLICRRCRSVAELDDADITGLVEHKADALGFSAIRQVLEIQGLCRHCRERDAG